MTWAADDTTAAAGQGWALDTIWDATKRRVELHVFKDRGSNIFPDDNAARMFVANQAMRQDKLAVKASKLAFQSRLNKT